MNNVILTDAIIALLGALTTAVGIWSARQHKKSSNNMKASIQKQIDIEVKIAKLESFQKVHKEQFGKIEKNQEKTNIKLDKIFEIINKK